MSSLQIYDRIKKGLEFSKIINSQAKEVAEFAVLIKKVDNEEQLHFFKI